MSDCRFGVSPVNYPDPDPEHVIVLCFFPSCLTRRLIACRHSILVYIDYDDKDLR